MGKLSKETKVSDNRIVNLELTKAAHELLKNDPLLSMQAIVDRFGSKERQRIEAGLETIILGLLEQRGGRPFGICHSCRHFRSAKGTSTRHCALLDVALTNEDAEKICAEQEPARPDP